MKFLLTYILIFFSAINVQAQDWKVVADLEREVIFDMYADKKSDLLYVGGGIDSINGKYIGDIAAWDGQNWIELDHGVNYDTTARRGGNIRHISRYKDKIVISGRISHVGYYKKSRNVAFWDSDSLKWETCDWNPDGSVNFIYETGDTTYVLGAYDSINGGYSLGANYLFNSKWTNMSPPKGVEMGEVLCRYKGSLYLGGNMNGSIPGVNDLARWDGSKFHPVGTGVSGGFGMVFDLVVYQNQLVIAGSFSGGHHIGDYIMTWDGKQFHNIGNANLTIDDLKVHNGILYACGGFTEIGGIKANQVAWYDGEKWQAMGKDFHSSINTIEVYKDKLYAFRNNNGDRELIQYKGTLLTSVQKNGQPQELKIYPNPASNHIEIKGLTPNDKVFIYNTSGSLLYSGTSKQVNVESLNSGLYFVKILSENKVVDLKFLKQ